MNIPFLDIRAAYNELKQEIDAAVDRVLTSGWYILGPEVEEFEDAFSGYTGAAHSIGLANGLDALHLALKVLEIGPGDEVIVPSNTFIATWLAVTQCGATVVPIEPDPLTYNINPEEIKASISPKTRAIIPVHLYGQPADLDPIINIGKENNIFVIEDAAQAHGAEYKNKRIGSHGDLVTWSFYPGKNLGALGDGGAITTNNKYFAEKLRTLRNYGSRNKYVHEELGFNSRLDPLQAAILAVKIAHLDSWNERRKKIAQLYIKGINNENVILPHVPEWVEPSWHLFVIQHPKRDRLQRFLQESGIQTLIHYPIPPHKQQAYKKQNFNLNLLLAEKLSKSILSLPIGPHLSHEEVINIIEKVNNFE